MPFDETASAITDGLFQIGGQHMANQANEGLAERQASWNLEQQQNQQRYDRRMWDLSNQYNSPLEQMARFKQAGLNPHLIYGKGTAGNTTALKSPDVKPYQRAEAKSVTEGLNMFGDIYRTRNLQAQTDNVRAQEQLTRETAALTGTKNLREQFAFGMENKLFPNSVSQAEETLAKMKAERRSSESNAGVAEQSAENRVLIVAEQLANARKTGSGIEKDNALKDFKLTLRDYGLLESDPAWSRAIAVAIQSPHKIKEFLRKQIEIGKQPRNLIDELK